MANTIKKYKITQLQENDSLLELHPETDADIVNYSGNIGGTTVTTVKGALDKIATGIGVTGVKGNAENAFRTGDVNLTPANLGAVAESVTNSSGNKTTSISRVSSDTRLEIRTQDTSGEYSYVNIGQNGVEIKSYSPTTNGEYVELSLDNSGAAPAAMLTWNAAGEFPNTFNLINLSPFASRSVSTTKPSVSSTDAQIPTAAAVWLGLEDRAPLASPAFTGTPTAPTATKGTNTTQIATTAFVMSAFEAADAMVYKGTQAGGSAGAYGALTPAANKGDTYKVSAAGKIDGVAVEVGDMLICNTDGTAAATTSNYTTIKANWDFIQTNIDGAVIGPASATDNHIALFDGNTGKLIKDGGYTIATSVPANAVFTDTWRNVKVNGSDALGTGTNTGPVNFANGGNITVTASNITGGGKNITLGVASGYSIPSDTTQTAWSAKYDLPSGGIPYTDMADVGYFELSADSGILTDDQYAETQKKYCIIKKANKIFLKNYGSTAQSLFSYYDVSLTSSQPYIQESFISVTNSNKNYITSATEANLYNRTYINTNFQPIIDSSHKLSADLVDDSSTTNKFWKVNSNTHNLFARARTNAGSETSSIELGWSDFLIDVFESDSGTATIRGYGNAGLSLSYETDWDEDNVTNTLTIGSGGVFVNGSEVCTSTGVTAGNYSAVAVNTKGQVTAGGQILEVGMAVSDADYNAMSAAEKAYYSSTSTGGYHKQVAPHTTLAEGGLFFQEI